MPYDPTTEGTVVKLNHAAIMCPVCKKKLVQKYNDRCRKCEWEAKRAELVQFELDAELEEVLVELGFCKNAHVGNYFVDYSHRYYKVILELDKSPESDPKKYAELKAIGNQIEFVSSEKLRKNGLHLIQDICKRLNVISNVVDKYKGLPKEAIKADLDRNKLKYAILLDNFQYNYNLGSCIRNANAFRCNRVYYVGRHKIDVRSTVGSHFVMDLEHLPTVDAVARLKDKYVFVGMELTDDAVPLNRFTWPQNSLILLGNEHYGLNPELQALCDVFVKINIGGSVRSLNVTAAGAIAMNSIVDQYGGV